MQLMKLIIITTLLLLTVVNNKKAKKVNKNEIVYISDFAHFQEKFKTKNFIIFNNYDEIRKVNTITFESLLSLEDFNSLFTYLQTYSQKGNINKININFKKACLFGRNRYDSKNSILVKSIFKLLSSLLNTGLFKFSFHILYQDKYIDGLLDLKAELKEYTDVILIHENLSVLNKNGVDMIPIIIHFHNKENVDLSNRDFMLII